MNKHSNQLECKECKGKGDYLSCPECYKRWLSN